MEIINNVIELEDSFVNEILFKTNNSNDYVLALHGWLDNANSFELLAKELDVNILAIDLPGHADSYFKSDTGQFHYVFYLSIIDEFIKRRLKDSTIYLMGHSLGAGLSSLYAGIFPEKVKKLILLDGIGSFTINDNTIHLQLKNYIKEYSNINNKRVPTYNEPDLAREAKKKACKLNDESIDILMQRALEKNDNGLYIWRNDRRLMLPSAQQLNESQVCSILSNITASTLLVIPENGFPYPSETMERRIKAINTLTIKNIFGFHHAHLDNSKKVAEIINKFLINE